MNTFSLFWRDVIFCKQIAWKVSSLLWRCEYLLVDAYLGSVHQSRLAVWFHQCHLVWVMRFFGLLFYTETVVHHLLFLVGEFIWYTFQFHTKHWCPLVAFDNFKNHLLDGCMRETWLGSSLCLGLPGWCLSHLAMMSLFLKLKKWVSLENSKTFYYRIDVLIRYHPDIIIYYGWILVLQQKIYLLIDV